MIGVGRGPASIVLIACALAMIALMLSVRADRPDWQEPMTVASILWVIVSILLIGVGIVAALLVPA